MEYIHKLKKLMCEELKSYENVSKVNEVILNDVWKLTDTIKNLDKIKMLEEGGSHNSYGSYDSYDEESSYRRGRGPGAKRDSMGRYSRESGYSEAEERSRDMSYMISHDQSKDHMMKQLGEMMRVANDSDKRILEQCMRDLDRA
jgi:methylmalonyl-CoA mutase N-terminal domain/subunit